MSDRVRFRNLIIPVAAAIVLYGVLALLFDFYYDLNDDVMIKDILSGIYTGMPDAHNNQMLYPISAILTGLYRITDRVPWFGLFEILCMVCGFVMVTYRIPAVTDRYDAPIGKKIANLSYYSSEESKHMWRTIIAGILSSLFLTVLFAALMLWELVHIQYTVVAGMLTMAAGVWLYCGDGVGVSDTVRVGLLRDRQGLIYRKKRDDEFNVTDMNGTSPIRSRYGYDRGDVIPKIYKKATYVEMGDFVRRNIPALILITVAFNIRSELVLLLSPILAAMAICKWSEEEYRWDRYVICGYLGVFLSICLLMLCSLGIDHAAYSSSEWREYRRFFDARTELYDFTGIPDYDENAAFYEEEGITGEQVGLLSEYNYYLDKSIDADMLERIVRGVRDGRAVGRSTYGKSIREAVWEYTHNALDISLGTMINGNNIMSTNTEENDIAVAELLTDHIFADEANQHKPFNVIVLILYVALISAAYFRRDSTYLIKLPTLVILRTIPWLYIYLQGRVLSRITHPLYMIELILLVAMLVRSHVWGIRNGSQKADNADKAVGLTSMKARIADITDVLAAALILIICLVVLPAGYRYISLSEQARVGIDSEADRVYAYTSSSPDTYYYIDTYSTVDRTEEIFGTKQITKKNTQLLGGWMGNSPLDTYKRSQCSSEEVITREKYLALTEDNK